MAATERAAVFVDHGLGSNGPGLERPWARTALGSNDPSPPTAGRSRRERSAKVHGHGNRRPFQSSRSVCDLLETLETLGGQAARGQRAERDAIASWATFYRPQLLEPHASTLAHVLSCLFPEVRADRVYAMRHSRLAAVVADALGVSGTARGRSLADTADLGATAAELAGQTLAPAAQDPVAVHELDHALDQLAALCSFSAPTVCQGWAPHAPAANRNRQTRSEILIPLLRRMRPHELKWLVRIVLKDLLPVVLPQAFVMGKIHFALPILYACHGTIPTAAHSLTGGQYDIFLPTPSPPHFKLAAYKRLLLRLLEPTPGVQIKPPSCYKARTFADVLAVCPPPAWAEVKYDGERMQIHVERRPGSSDPVVRIFSKSGRDSTVDRAGIHRPVLTALSASSFRQRIVLEAELVVYDQKRQRVAEFHRIVDHVDRFHKRHDPAVRHENLMAVFFDVLVVDGESLLAQPYTYRRRCLEEHVSETPGEVVLATRVLVDDLHQLQTVFHDAVEVCGEEGLVIKGHTDTYVDCALGASRWVKLKRDYISGLGDTLDVAIVGCGVDGGRTRERNREYRPFTLTAVDPATPTTFFVGCATNVDAIRFVSTPPAALTQGHAAEFDVQFAVTYGLSREQLQFLKDMARIEGLPYKANQDVRGNNPARTSLPFRYFLGRDLPCAMTTVFETPLVFEIVCAGFDKPSGSVSYVPRWPRVIKIHRDRLWRADDVVSYVKLQSIAQTVNDRRRPYVPADAPRTHHKEWQGSRHLRALDLERVLGNRTCAMVLDESKAVYIPLKLETQHGLIDRLQPASGDDIDRVSLGDREFIQVRRRPSGRALLLAEALTRRATYANLGAVAAVEPDLIAADWRLLQDGQADAAVHILVD
ncbi:uncharacterized protein V1510DRAFT_441790 [Dipodascopsis tothii]|uniref:uncharacterized protein n=1 Tax=Dipodascopsis tothii TaxID=44089 RepID=UPI0034CF6A78